VTMGPDARRPAVLPIMGLWRRFVTFVAHHPMIAHAAPRRGRDQGAGVSR
jgi:hypothetical protein